MEREKLGCIAATLFVLAAFPEILVFALLMPLGQNPDEATHFQRATAIAEGHFLAERRPVSGPGSRLDAGSLADQAAFDAAVLARTPHPLSIPPLPWSGNDRFLFYGAPAMYFPALYAPAALTIAWGRAGNHSVQTTLLAARLANGLASITIAAIALLLSGPGMVPLFAVLTLPMPLSLMAAVSLDGIVIACAALAAALLSRAATSRDNEAVRCLLIALLCVLAIARPPYLCLCLPLAILPWSWRWRAGGLAAILAGFSAYEILIAVTAAYDTGALIGADPGVQLGMLMRNPFSIVPVAIASARADAWRLLKEFVGVLGQLNVVFPVYYQRAADAFLTAACAASAVLTQPDRVERRRRTAFAAAILGAGLLACGGIFVAQYLLWTKPGYGIVKGVQGRYFIPIAVMCAAAFPPVWRPRTANTAALLLCALAAFCSLGVAVGARAIVLRYCTG